VFGAATASAQPSEAYNYARAYRHFLVSRYDYRTLYSSIPGQGGVIYGPFGHQRRFVDRPRLSSTSGRVSRGPKMLRYPVWLAAFVVAGLACHARADGPDAARIERLVRQPGSEKFAEREAASKKALDAAGQAALPALKKATDSDDLEFYLRTTSLCEDIHHMPHGADLLLFLPSGLPLAIGGKNGRGEFVLLSRGQRAY
jgi:hypothetical protein